jgi:16S rRNA (cytosine967-C5)-methyltransferase
LRINLQRIRRDDYAATLRAAGILFEGDTAVPEAVRLAEPRPVQAIPGFAEGQVSVQDAAAQLATLLLKPEPGQRVLDACAAPGGKACHLLERVPDLELLALDLDDARLARVEENLQRLGLTAVCRAADAANPESWWDGRPFDRILVDAPCSGTGVIRRHPDIKWLRRDTDIAPLARRQRLLLENLWPLLARGGILVYASCSVIADEGPTLLAGFIQSHADAAELAIEADWGERCVVGRRLRPGERDMDGFYFGRVVKN